MPAPVENPGQPDHRPRHHDLDFVEIDDPAALLEAGRPRAFRLVAPARSPPPGPLRVSGPEHPQIRAEHDSRRLVPGGTLYAIPGHLVGGAGLLLRDGSVFWRADCLPSYFWDQLQPGKDLPEEWVHGLLRPGLQVVRADGPVAVATHGNQVYGHFLLEMLPKLWLLVQARALGLSFRLAVSRRRVPWLDALIGLYFSERELIWYDSDTQLVEAPLVLVPSLLCDQDYHLHPAFNLVADDFVGRARAGASAPGAGPRVFLSRARHEGGRLSLLGNAAEIEAAAVAMGFTIVHPETLSIRDQIGILAQATCLAGEYGSALHAALFAPRGATVVCLNRFNPVQHRIAALRGQSLGLIEPREGFRLRINNQPDANQPVTIDPDAMARLLGTLLGEPPLPRTAIPTVSLPVGDSLAQRMAAGRVTVAPELAPAARRSRVPLWHAEPIDPAVAPFGPLFTDPGFRTYESGSIRLARLTDVVVAGSEGLLLVEGRLLRDSLHGLEAWRTDSLVAGVGVESVALRRPLRPATPADARRPCFLGFTAGWRNHAHWLIECLPRLGVFLGWRAREPGLALLLPRLPEDSLQLQTVAQFGIAASDIVTIGDDEAMPCAVLWCMTGIDAWRPPLLVRDAAGLLSAAVQAGGTELAGTLPTRLYLRGGPDAPPMPGLDALRPALRAAGLAVLDTLPPLDELVRLLRSARLVVAEHGPSLAAIVFARPGCRVLELFGPAGAQPAFWTLASLCELDYGFAVGTHDPQPGLEHPSGRSAWRITAEHLRQALAVMDRPAP